MWQALKPVSGAARTQVIAAEFFAQLNVDANETPSASALFVKSALASTASCPASVTISSRPSVGQDGEGYTGDLRLRKTRIFLQKGLDMQISDLPVGSFRSDEDGGLRYRQFARRTAKCRLYRAMSAFRGNQDICSH